MHLLANGGANNWFDAMTRLLRRMPVRRAFFCFCFCFFSPRQQGKPHVEQRVERRRPYQIFFLIVREVRLDAKSHGCSPISVSGLWSISYIVLNFIWSPFLELYNLLSTDFFFFLRTPFRSFWSHTQTSFRAGTFSQTMQQNHISLTILPTF